MRERFWLERLADHLGTETIFVCGDAYVEGFVGLLNEKGVASRIVDRAIGVNDGDRYTWESAFGYLGEHPELRS